MPTSNYHSLCVYICIKLPTFLRDHQQTNHVFLLRQVLLIPVEGFNFFLLHLCQGFPCLPLTYLSCSLFLSITLCNLKYRKWLDQRCYGRCRRIHWTTPSWLNIHWTTPSWLNIQFGTGQLKSGCDPHTTGAWTTCDTLRGCVREIERMCERK